MGGAAAPLPLRPHCLIGRQRPYALSADHAFRQPADTPDTTGRPNPAARFVVSSPLLPEPRHRLCYPPYSDPGNKTPPPPAT